MEIGDLIAQLNAMPRDTASDPEADFVAGCQFLQEHSTYRIWKMHQTTLRKKITKLQSRFAKAQATVDSATRNELQIEDSVHQLVAANENVACWLNIVRQDRAELEADKVFLHCVELAKNAHHGPERLRELLKDETNDEIKPPSPIIEEKPIEHIGLLEPIEQPEPRRRMWSMLCCGCFRPNDARPDSKLFTARVRFEKGKVDLAKVKEAFAPTYRRRGEVVALQ